MVSFRQRGLAPPRAPCRRRATKIVGLADIGGGLCTKKASTFRRSSTVYTQKKTVQDFPAGGTICSRARCSPSSNPAKSPSCCYRKSINRGRKRASGGRRQFSAKAPTAPPLQADALWTPRAIITVPATFSATPVAVTVSYFEWVQDRQGFFWLESEVTSVFSTSGKRLRRSVRYAETQK